MYLSNEKAGTRRDFFRRIGGKLGEAALRGVERKARGLARSFVRPPGALSETEFLAACTRCEACVTACPHNTIFLLGTSSTLSFNTPALDLVGKACHLCTGFPCIAACEPGALVSVEPQNLRLASIRIDRQTCLPYQGPECGVCVSLCPVPGAIALNGTLPVVHLEKCTGCAICREVCVVSPSAITVFAPAPE